MSLFFGRGAPAEQRSLDFQTVWGSGSGAVKTYEGSAATALRLIPVYAAVALISDSIATLPVQLFRGSGPDRQRIPDSGFLTGSDPSLTWVDWVTQLMTALLLRGNAYGLCTFVGPTVQRVDWINPDAVQVRTEDGHPVYSISGGPEQLDYAHGGRILHVRAFLEPGSYKGLSPIDKFKASFSLQQRAIDYGDDWFEGGGIPTGTLKNTLSQLDAKVASAAKQRFLQQQRKPGPVVLDKNWTYDAIAITPDQSQFLATIRAGATTTASIFRVNPEDIGGESGKSMTYANREQDQQRFNVRTLLPWVIRIEHALNQLLPRPQFLKFNLDGLARPTLKDRIDSNFVALKSGQVTLAEVRALDDRQMLTAEEVAFWQQNYATAKSESASQQATTTGAS